MTSAWIGEDSFWTPAEREAHGPKIHMLQQMMIEVTTLALDLFPGRVQTQLWIDGQTRHIVSLEPNPEGKDEIERKKIVAVATEVTDEAPE